jgi:hypothetical protein
MAVINTVRNVQEKGTTVLAWLSFFFAVLGGTAGAGMFLGTAVRFSLGLLGELPWAWTSAIPAVLLVGLAIAVFIDLLLDLEPNQTAVYSAIFIPSVASAAPGGFGDRITRWTNDLMGWAGGHLSAELGSGAPTVVAMGCIVAALVMARRVIKKSAGVPAGMSSRTGMW